MYSAIDIAKYFVNLNNELTELQIQKLVYYSYVWYIVKFNNDKDNIVNKLFDERPQAWKYGPVFVSIYEAMRCCDKGFICKTCLIEKEYECKLDDKTQNLLYLVYKVYGKFSGNTLSDMTRSEDPWKKTSLENEIKDTDVYEYFSKSDEEKH